MTKSLVRCGVVALVLGVSATTVRAGDMLEDALARAYVFNPVLNSQRALVRATDESVSSALGGYRPKISASADAGYGNLRSKAVTRTTGRRTTSKFDEHYDPSGYGISISQNLFNGFATGNTVRQAEFSVLQARENLRMTEQNVLLDSSSSYMDVLRDSAIVDLRRRNVDVIEEQLRAVRDRFDVGEVTRTDVAQAEARIAASRSQMALAEAVIKSSKATYMRHIGAEPNGLRPGRPVDRLLPSTLAEAIAQGRQNHPAVQAAMYAVDAAQMAVKVAEAALYPSVNVDGSLSQRWEASPQSIESLNATVLGRVTVPVYQGGSEYSAIRQAKEILGQRRVDVDTARESVRALVVQTWGQLEAAKAQVQAANAQIEAAGIALNGVREEARVGQRTTLDALNAQQELLDARVTLVSAQRDRVVASYAVLAAIGGLSAQRLGLKVPQYNAEEHYSQVRDLWSGVRTPDGK